MINFIPLEYYTSVYYHLLMLVVFIIWFSMNWSGIEDEKLVLSFNALGYVFLAVFILYMGLRPLSGRFFGDMVTYAHDFGILKFRKTFVPKRDILFNYFMYACSKLMELHQFFLLIAFMYVLPCYLFAKKYTGRYWFFVLIMFVGSFSFWGYGTNGLRNGLATSVFILALTCYDRKWLMFPLLAVSFGIHNSMLIPITAFIVSGLWKNPKIYLYVWLACIPLSLAGGGFWENFFGSLGFGDDNRAADYLTEGNVNNDTFAYTGFRWDFLFYSSFAVFAGWYFIFKKDITDKFYIHLWGTYMIANAFWILVIRANFSNRFAYLSWFLMAAVIAYPLLRYKMWSDGQSKVIGTVILVYYLFTYLMFLKG